MDKNKYQEKIEDKVVYPQYLSNKPEGVDLFDGKSQERLASAVAKHIRAIDAMKEPLVSRLIGLEGKWGIGKSNVIGLLHKELKEKYYSFCFDAWGNQEDLQRRSILELLTKKLITDEKLNGMTTYRALNSNSTGQIEEKKCTWPEKLESLLSRKSYSKNITVPSVNNWTKVFVLLLLVTGLLIPLLDLVGKCLCWWADILIIFGPILLFLLTAACCGKLKDMWAMYNTDSKSDTTSFVISEQEPSVREFKDWMEEISKGIPANEKLVLVFDNMDRLPARKVQQFWSLIQTFFADGGYPNIWCIIPYDEEHLAAAFSEAEDSDVRIELLRGYLDKTFPVVYRIPDPIITDYKVVFDKLFERAYGKRDEQELINRCYRLKNPKPNIRDVISFINKLVSLTNQWGENVKLSSMALFLLNQDEILKSPEDSIVKRKYMKGLEGLFEQNEELDTEISALTYGVDTEDARQLPMKNLINQALNSTESGSFVEYSERSVHFYSILKEEIDGMDAALLNNAINNVGVILTNELNEEDAAKLKAVWKTLANLYINSKEKETTFRKEVKTLMSNCTNKNAVGNHFLKLFTNSDNAHKGAEWYRVYKDFSEFAKGLELTMEMPEKQMESIDFVEYLRTAKEDYKNYPIKCANEPLNTFCQEQIANNLDVSDILKLTVGDERYDFSKLKDAARKMVEEQEVISSNFESVIKVLKLLNNEPMKLDIDGFYFSGLHYEGELKPDYNVLLMLAKQEINGLTESDYEDMSKVIFRYESMKTVWVECLSVNTTVYSEFVAFLIMHKIHDGKVTNTKDVISEMVTIVSKTGVDRKDVVLYLNDWGRRELTQEERQLDFAKVLPQEAWIDALKLDKNDFAKALLGKYYNDCSNKACGEFVDSSNVWKSNNYWAKVMKRAVNDEDFWRIKPGNVAEIVNLLIEGICAKTIVENTMDENLLNSFLTHVKFVDVSSKVNEMMDKFAGTYCINLYIFQKLHHYFEQTKNHEVLFLNKILMPIINHEPVQAIVLNNLKFYENLLKSYIDQASDLKTMLIKMHDSSKNPEWISLIDRLGIIELKEDENKV